MKVLSTDSFVTIEYDDWIEFSSRSRTAMSDVQSSSGATRPSSIEQASFLYRGHGCESFPLSPKFDRMISPGDSVQQKYKDLIDRFHRLATDRSLIDEDLHQFKSYGGRRSRFAYEAVAQHRGVPTRLLDWTHSPYVAAFFAFANTSDCKSGRVCVWALDVPYSQYAFRPEDFEVIAAYVPRNYRQLYQQGAFTINDTTKRRTEDLFGPDGPFQFTPAFPILFKHVIPVSEKVRAMEDLRLMRIDHTTLFPDMDGIARYLIETFFPT